MSTQRRTLRALDDLGSASTEEIRVHLGLADVGGVISELTRLERYDLVTYDPTTNRYGLTKKAIMRKNRRRNKNSPGTEPGGIVRPLVRPGTGGASTTAEIADPSRGGGTATEATPVHSPAVASVANINEKIEQEILDFDGPSEFARWVCRDEPEIFEALSLAMAEGMAVPDDLVNVVSFKRLPLLADLIEDHQKRKVGGPCSACGCVVPPRTRYVSGGYLSSEEPTFHPRKGDNGMTALCSWCHDFLTNGHTTDELRERVGNALAGVATSPAPGFHYRFAYRALVPFFHEVDGAIPGAPWGHISAVQRRAIEMRTEQVVHPRRLIRTEGDAQRQSLPSLPAKIHTTFERPEYVEPAILGEPGRRYEKPALPARVPPTIKRREPTPEEALYARHEAERSQYLAEHPRPAQTLGAPEGAPWSGLAGWSALLDRHEAEQRSLQSARGAEAQAMEQRHAAARDAYLRDHPRPRFAGDWDGEDGWTELLEAQEVERRRITNNQMKVN